MKRQLLLGLALFALLCLEGCCCPVRRQARIMARYGVLTPNTMCCPTECCPPPCCPPTQTVIVRPSSQTAITQP